MKNRFFVFRIAFLYCLPQIILFGSWYLYATLIMMVVLKKANGDSSESIGMLLGIAPAIMSALLVKSFVCNREIKRLTRRFSVELMKNKIEKLASKVLSENLILLDAKEKKSEYMLRKIYDWQEQYDWVEWGEFRDCWLYCNICKSYNEGQCICYAR